MCIGEKFCDIAGRQVHSAKHYHRDCGEHVDRLKGTRIEGWFRMEQVISEDSRWCAEQRAAVGGGSGDRLGADVSASSRTILDDNLLSEDVP